MAARKSNSFSKEQTELQRRVVELEEQRESEKQKSLNSALIHAEIDFEEAGGRRYPRKIMIWNQGMAIAENLKIFIDDNSPLEADYLYTEESTDQLEVLPPGDHYAYPFQKMDENQPPVRIKIIYEDPQRNEQEYETKLRL